MMAEKVNCFFIDFCMNGYYSVTAPLPVTEKGVRTKNPDADPFMYFDFSYIPQVIWLLPWLYPVPMKCCILQ